MAGNVTDGGRAASIFNSMVAAWAVAAAWEIGALDELATRQSLDASDFAAQRGLDPQATLGMFRALASVEIVSRVDSTVAAGPAFDDVYRNRSFFHWLARGSSDVFRDMPTILPTSKREGRFYSRDAAAIAFACREINEITFDPAFWSIVGGLDFTPAAVADLGCGSGGRITKLLERFPGAFGVGVDIAEPPLIDARKDIAAAGFGDRSIFVQADVLRLPPRPEFATVELLTCFMMGHDFWPREQCLATLRSLRTAFPSVRRFLLGDASRSVGTADADLRVFTLAFEVGHDLMGTHIPTVDEWHSVLPDSGWDLVRTHWIDTNVGEVIFELA